MASFNLNARRRHLPVLGMTSLGLAVSAGSLGLFRVAVAEPPLQWNAAANITKVAEVPTPDSEVIQAALQVPTIPQPSNEWPPLPSSTPLPAPTPMQPIVIPSLPKMPEPMMPAAPATIVLPSTPQPPAPIEVPPIKVHNNADELPLPRLHVPPVTRTEEPRIAIPQPAQPENLAGSLPSPQPMEPRISLPAAPQTLSVTPTATAPGVPAIPVGLSGRAQPNTTNDTAGELPMIPSFTNIKSAVLGMALAATPAQAVPDKIPATDDTKKTEATEKKTDPVAELKLALETIRKEVEAERKTRELLSDELLGKKTGDGKTELGLVQKVESMDARLKKIETLLLKLDERMTEMATNKTVAEKPPTKETVTDSSKEAPKQMPSEKAIVGPKATLRLVNEYPVPISMLVNGKSYRIEQGQVRTIEIPAGDYDYELLHSGSEVVKATIKENATMTLRIR